MTDSQPAPSDDQSPEEGASRAEHRERQRRNRRWRLAAEWLAVIVVALLAALGIKAWLIQAYYIPSGSMIPTLQIGDRILVDKVSYHLHPIHRGDIVVFATPPADQGDPQIKDLVKRVVGLPGDTISASNGHVDIDGHPLSETYLPPGSTTVNLTTQRIPSGEYFVMGDNRSDSKDSRSFGPISGSLVVGRAVMRVWPISQVSLL